MKLEVLPKEIVGSNLSSDTKLKILEFLFEQERLKNAKQDLNEGRKSINDTRKIIDELSRPRIPEQYRDGIWYPQDTVPLYNSPKPLIAWSSVVTQNKK